MSVSAHRLIALLLLVSLVVGGQWIFERYWIGRYRLYQDTREQLEDQLFRYRRLLTQRPVLEQRLNAVKADDSVDVYYLAQGSPTLAATELQRRASQAVQSTGAKLTSTQVLPVSDEEGFTKVAIRVQLTGDADNLQKTLHTLESARPLIFIDNVNIRSRTIRQRVRRQRNQNNPRQRARAEVKTSVQLTAQFEIAGFMQKGK